jgi:2-polyprenyl-3-methyl-5-hydroxy-6-metoxy-1,4-benzoquinol methylase
MNTSPNMDKILNQTQSLALTYLGIIHGLFVAIGRGAERRETLAIAVGRDDGYVGRWLDAAIAAQLVLVDSQSRLLLGPRGESFARTSNNVDVAKVLQAVYSVLIADAMSPNFLTGVRPGYAIVNQFTNLQPWYGSIFESLYGPVWQREVEPNLPCIAQADAACGTCVDYGCGDGWLLRRIASTTKHLRCLGLTDGETNSIPSSPRVSYAKTSEFLADSNTYEIIILNKVVHHLGVALEKTMEQLVQKLVPGGSIVVWDFEWPVEPGLESNTDDRFFLNLVEYVQASGFVDRSKLVHTLRSLALTVREFAVRDGRELLLVGTL